MLFHLVVCPSSDRQAHGTKLPLCRLRLHPSDGRARPAGRLAVIALPPHDTDCPPAVLQPFLLSGDVCSSPSLRKAGGAQDVVKEMFARPMD